MHILSILGLYGENGKEHESFYTLLKFCGDNRKEHEGHYSLLRLYGDNGKVEAAIVYAILEFQCSFADLALPVVVAVARVVVLAAAAAAVVVVVLTVGGSCRQYDHMPPRLILLPLDAVTRVVRASCCSRHSWHRSHLKLLQLG